MISRLFGRKATGGDDFETVAMPMADTLYTAALRMTRDPMAAEDLVQETLMRAYRFWHKFQKGTNVKGWLLRIQTNIFINRYRKRRTEQKVLDSREIDDLLERHAVIENTYLPPETRDSFVKQVVGDEVLEALDRLPFEFRMAVLLADMHQMSYREIAEILDCPVGTVMSRLHRARKLLQAQLFEYAVDNGIIQRPDGVTGENVANLDMFRRRKAASNA